MTAGSNPKKPHSLWARAAAWTAIGVGALVLLAVIVVAAALHSPRLHKYILATAEKKASEALGVQVQLQNYAIHLSNLSLDVYGIKVHGAAPYPEPPLLQVQHAHAGVRVVSILRRKWYLDSVRIDHPVVHVFTGANGDSNLPKLKGGGGGKTNLFDLGIRHAILDRGEVYYNDRESLLDADLHDLEFRSEFSVPERKYSGTLSYRDGHLRTGSLNTIPHDLDARFEATPAEFHLTQAKLTSGPSQLVLTATLKDYSHPSVQGHYQAVLDGNEIRRILRTPSVPSGTIHASGAVQYQDAPGRSVFERLGIDGSLSSRQLDLRAASLRVLLSSVAARYSLENGNLTVQNLRAQILGGMLSASLMMRDLTGNSHSELNARLQRISLAGLKRLAPSSPATQGLALGGIVNADAKATWGKSLESLVARVNATIQGNVSRLNRGGRPRFAKLTWDVSPGSESPVAATLSIQGVLHGTYTAANERLALTHSYLQMPQTTLTMDGAIGTRSSLALHFESKDLRELETIAEIVRTPKPDSASAPLGLAGTASFEGTVRGSMAAPHLTGHLTASNLQVKGTSWRKLRTGVDLSPSSASLHNAELEPAGRGRITLDASAGLKKWKFENASPIDVTLHASQLAVGDLVRITGLQTPVAGVLEADVQAHGSALNPIGQGSVSLTHAKLYGEPIQSAKLAFTGTGSEVHANLAVHLPAGTLESVVSVRPKEQSYAVQVTANGIQLDRLETLKAHNLEAKGQINLNASGQGTFRNPEVKAAIEIPQLEIQNQGITGIALQMNVANHVADATLSAREGNAPIQARAQVNLTGDYPMQASLDTQPIALGPFMAAYAPAETGKLSGETEIHAILKGPLKRKGQLEAHVTVPTLKVAYGSAVQIAAVSPIHLDYQNWVLTLQRTAIRGTDIDLQLQGEIPVHDQGSPSLLLLGTVNLQIAQLLNPDIRSSGELRFNINGSGAQNASGMEGKVELVDANFANGDWPVGLQHGNGVFTLTKDRLNINQLSGAVGGGKLTAQGGVAYRPHTQFDLGVTARGVRMLYPAGVREELDADIRLTGTQENALLGGRVRLTDLSFTPDFDFVNLITQFGGVSPPPSQGFAQNLNLNLAVSSTSNLNLVSRTLSIGGTANLQVRGTAARPVILGRINLNNGDVIFNGSRFLLSGGTVEFANPSETQPVVNLALNTTIQQYSINLRFRGPVDHLRTNYASDPALPEADIINLLAFGSTTEASAANPATPGRQAAMSMVASQVSSQITSRVSKIAGISQLSINPVLGGGSSQGPAGANITIQQRVTGNLFVTFSSNVTSTENQVIMGQYRVSPRVAVSATRDQNGGFAFDVTLKKTW